jgi:hypothetical protein
LGAARKSSSSWAKRLGAGGITWLMQRKSPRALA